MKVKDLIKELQQLPQEADIGFRMADGCCGDSFELGDPELEDMSYRYKGHGHEYINFDFPPLDFLSSCMKSSAAQGNADAFEDKCLNFKEELKKYEFGD